MGAKIPAKTVLQLVALTLLFAGLNYIGSTVYQRAAGFTTIKPVCGVALAILLIQGRAALWPVLITGFVGGVLAKLAFGLTLGDTAVTLGLASASLLATYLLTERLIGRAVEFRAWKQLLGFIAIAIAVSAVSGLGFAAAYVVKHGTFASASFITNYRAWWVPTSLSYVIFTPVICLLATAEPGKIYANRRRIAGSLALLATVLAVTFVPTQVPLSFLVPLALLIVTMVSEIEGTAIGLVMTQIVYSVVILCGTGPAALRHMPVGLQLHYAQVFLGFLIMVLLPVAAAVTERSKLQKREIEINRALRDSEKRYREMAQREHDASKAKSEFLAGDEPRIAHAAQRHPGLLGSHPGRDVWPAGPPQVPRICARRAQERRASAGPDQRRAGPVQDRRRQDGAARNPLRDCGPGGGKPAAGA